MICTTRDLKPKTSNQLLVRVMVYLRAFPFGLRTAAIALMGLLWCGQAARAQNQNGNSAGNTYSWTPTSGVLNWNSASWSPAAGVYGPWGSFVTAELLSTLSAAQIITITNAISLNELDIGSSAAFSFNINGAGLVFSSNAAGLPPLIFVPASAAAPQVITAPIVLNNSLIITNNSANLLTLNGGITALPTATGITSSGAGSVLIGTANLAILAGPGNNFTITNSGSGVFAIASAITGPGNLVLNNTSTGSIVLGAVQNAGSITNSGTGSGAVAINGIISAAVTGGVIQNSATSTLTLSGANTFTSGLTILSGTVIVNATAAAGVAASSLITLGATGGSNSATLLNDGVTTANAITLGTTSGTLTIGSNFGGATAVFSGALNLNGNNLTISGGWRRR